MSDSTSYTNRWQYAGAGERYDSGIYGEDSWDTLLSVVEGPLLFALLHRRCPEHSGASALDFACGTGRILLFMQPHVRSLMGVDVSPEMLKEAQRKLPNVQLLCTDIVASPATVPGNQDVITCFRFLRSAEPELRLNCIRELAKKLRSETGIMIFGIHASAWNYRTPLIALYNRVFRGKRSSRGFSPTDMRQLAGKCGLEIIDATGFGFIPRHLGKYLPGKLSILIERALASRPLIWRFGSNLIVICRRKQNG